MAKPTKRSALEALTKRSLSVLVHHFGLDIATSRPKADHVDALAGSKTASFAAILAELKRSDLKDICRAHELDDSGKEKAPIAARILGEEPAPAAPEEAETFSLALKAKRTSPALSPSPLARTIR